jgi:MoxR-like ATPase
MEDLTRTDAEVHIDKAGTIAGRLLQGLGQVIRGKEEFLSHLIACLFAEGHVLIEDLPGLGKTTVAKTLAALISADTPETDSSGPGHTAGGASERFFRRIQCTPDLLPYDITGVDVFNPESRSFDFRPGPVFTHILLADEINRTTPKVQSALLEVMAEGQVTVGLSTYRLERPFFVMATQNPVETEGTYLLPLAQADRFLMRLSIGYPGPEAELSILTDNPAEALRSTRPVCGKNDILEAQEAAGRIYCDPKLARAVIALSSATRVHRSVLYGVSPRGSLMLLQAARALALLKGRTFVTDQDLVELAPLVLAHRIKLKDVRVRAEDLTRELVLAAVKNGDGG